MVVTALVQAVLGGIGLAIPACLTLPVDGSDDRAVSGSGPLPVLIPAIIWLCGQATLGHRAAGLERRRRLSRITHRMGADLPLLLILSGNRHLIAFGMIDVFIGPASGRDTAFVLRMGT